MESPSSTSILVLRVLVHGFKHLFCTLGGFLWFKCITFLPQTKEKTDCVNNGSFVSVPFVLIGCSLRLDIQVLSIKMSARPYMKVALGLKKLVWSWMLQRGSRGSHNQSKRLLTKSYKLFGIPNLYYFYIFIPYYFIWGLFIKCNCQVTNYSYQ